MTSHSQGPGRTSIACRVCGQQMRLPRRMHEACEVIESFVEAHRGHRTLGFEFTLTLDSDEMPAAQPRLPMPRRSGLRG